MLKKMYSLVNAKAVIVGCALFVCVSQTIIDWQIYSSGGSMICACPSKGKMATFLLISSLFLFSKNLWPHLLGMYFTLIIGSGFWRHYYFFATDIYHTLFSWDGFDHFVCEQGFIGSLIGFLSFAIFLYSICLVFLYFYKFLLSSSFFSTKNL